MDEFITIKQVELRGHHRQPERVGATIHAGGTVIPTAPFVSLQIAQYAGEESCYLFHISKQGDGTDTFHESLDEALAYAEQLYGVSRTEWTDVSFPFGSDEHP